MIKKISNCLLVILSLTALFFGEIFIRFGNYLDIDRVTSETIFMPIFALSKISLPFFILGLLFMNLTKGSLVVGIIFLVIGSTVMISGFDRYETWNKLLEENAEDQRFQNNFSKQLPFQTFSIIEGILILSAGMYFTIRYLRKRKIGKKQEHEKSL